MTHNPPLVDDVALTYLDWCSKERVPANTVRRRRAVLRAVGTPSTISRAQIEAWWASRRHLSPVTQANDLAVLRTFYRWCARWDHRADDPTSRLDPPKATTGAPRPVSTRDLQKILDQVKTQPDVRRAVLLAAYAGLRREEIARLSWDDIDPDSRRARVLGKGQKIRSVKLSVRLLEQLGEDPGGDAGINVVTRSTTAWTADTIGRKVNTAIKAAGVDATIHKLRHRYGTLGYQLEKDPKALAEQMGHSSVATTLKFYAAAADEAGGAIADAVANDGIDLGTPPGDDGAER